MFTLTKSEHEVMMTLWKAERPLYRSEFIAESPNRSWSTKTLPAVLNTMLNKGAIKVDGFVRAGKVYARAYVPAVTEEEYALMQLSANLPSEEGKPKIEGIFAALMNTEEVDQNTLDNLRKLIDQKEGELNE